MGRAPIQWLRGFVLATILVIPSFATAQDTWTQVGTQSSNRILATLTTLADGRVLIVGGLTDVDNPVALNTVDINDPGALTTVAGAPLAAARFGHSAMRLPDGRVLVVGGTDAANNPVPAVEIYDPATNSWSPGAPMAIGATRPGMSLLPNGRVLVSGTDTINGNGAGADIYDPVSNTWAPAGPLNASHGVPAVVTLPDGRVLLVGGSFSTTAEIYDPVGDTWTATGPMAFTDYGFGSVYLMADGRALHISTVLNTEFFDFGTNTWTAGASMFPTPTEAYSAQTQLADGRILAAGGGDLNTSVDLATTRIYDPASDSWSTGTPMLSTHAMGQFAKLPNGRFVIAGALLAPTTVIEMTGPNTAPAANAGPDLNGSTCNACLGGVAVSAAGTVDAEGDAITYIWSLGATVLATTTQPSVVLSLPAGTTVVTLTARDSFGAEGTDTVSITMTNVDDVYTAAIATLQAQVLTLQDTIATQQAEITALTASNAILQAQLDACVAGGGGGDNITPLMDAFEQYMRTQFHNPTFELPGTTSISELQNLLNTLKRLDNDAQKKLYRALSGRKMHPAHKGRSKPHWDDDCDWGDR